LNADGDRDSVSGASGWERAMMGRRKQNQGQLFYEFCIAEVVPDDHLVRKIRGLLDLSWVYAELAPTTRRSDDRRSIRC
jgi:hypothetical protein